MRRSLVICVVLLFGPPLVAQEVDSDALSKAQNFLGARKRGELVHGFAHFGTQYLGHTYNRTATVQDGTGRKIPGHFALVYDYQWSDGGETRIGFLCDGRGNVYRVQVLSTNGVFQRPFVVANASMRIVGEALYEATKDNLNDRDRQLMRTLIDNADAQGLLELGLRLQQATGN